MTLTFAAMACMVGADGDMRAEKGSGSERVLGEMKKFRLFS
jgi:hypothetical protein